MWHTAHHRTIHPVIGRHRCPSFQCDAIFATSHRYRDRRGLVEQPHVRTVRIPRGDGVYDEPGGAQRGEQARDEKDRNQGGGGAEGHGVCGARDRVGYDNGEQYRRASPRATAIRHERAKPGHGRRRRRTRFTIYKNFFPSAPLAHLSCGAGLSHGVRPLLFLCWARRTDYLRNVRCLEATVDYSYGEAAVRGRQILESKFGWNIYGLVGGFAVFNNECGRWGDGEA
mmetsp:Transcript_12718/g.31044  ORF Transcript_12718/g.31044 Transcript_12718/m.31044 type:complete len:227 (+) Transcript_12718:944-1624(+)